MESETIIVTLRLANNFLNTIEPKPNKISETDLKRMTFMILEKKFVPVICFDKQGVLFSGETSLQCIVKKKITCKCLAKYDMDNNTNK